MGCAGVSHVHSRIDELLSRLHLVSQFDHGACFDWEWLVSCIGWGEVTWQPEGSDDVSFRS